MASFEAFDVVVVPFPFTDRHAEKRRPALVLSSAMAFNRPAGHSVMAMITSASHAPWPLDVAIEDLKAAGLPAPSILRFKLFTLDHRLVRSRLGRLGASDRAKVRAAVRRLLPQESKGELREYDEAMRRFLSRKPIKFKNSGKGYPKRDELYDRGRLR